MVDRAIHSGAELSRPHSGHGLEDHPGRVRGGDTLYVASREGVVQAIPWCGGCLTNAAMARETATMADRAAVLGLG
ncbi:hypothetical protein ACWGE0_13015 [Lentzea sp. NPDC054927]